MDKLKKCFGGLELSWKNLLIFSVVTGLAVGILNRIPLLNDTSFQDIAISYEMWFVLAIFVITNCKDWKNAVSKCFVFFLISQPVIYLVELVADVAINKADFMQTAKTLFVNYYIGAGWLFITFLTIPGALIAFQIKKDNILSGVILSVATCFLAVKGSMDFAGMIHNGTFPRHLLNALLCFAFAFLLIFIIITDKKAKIIALALTGAALAGGIIYSAITLNSPVKMAGPMSYDLGLEVKALECVSEDESIATAELSEDGITMYVDTSKNLGETRIIVTDAWGEEHIYNVEVTNNTLNISEPESE